jgi:hypothetical protein
MATMPYTEDTLARQTTTERLLCALRLDLVYACNSKDFGPGSLLDRGTVRRSYE